MFRFTSRHILAALLLSVGASSTWSQTTLKLGHAQSATSAFQVGAQTFADEVAKLTKGRYKVEVVPAAALGAEKELVEKAIAGTVDLVVTSTGPLGGFVPDVLITDIPFIFRDYAHARDYKPVQMVPVLPGTVPVLTMLAQERGFAAATHAG